MKPGFTTRPRRTSFNSGSNRPKNSGLAAEGIGDRQPPDHLRSHILNHMDSLPAWYPSAEANADQYPLHALTQRPMAMYHSWGSQNAWLRQIHGVNPLYVPTEGLGGAAVQ